MKRLSLLIVSSFLAYHGMSQESRQINNENVNAGLKTSAVKSVEENSSTTTTETIEKPANLNATLKTRMVSTIPTDNSGNGPKTNSYYDPELYRELGLDPETNSVQDLKTALNALNQENPEEFQRIAEKYTSKKSNPSTIKRSDFEAMSDERKEFIMNNPERYTIVD